MVGDTNERGERHLEFAQRQNVPLVNTLFPYTISRRTTWHSANGVTHNQTDYIITMRLFKSSIDRANSRTFPGVGSNSDHDLLIGTMKMKLKFEEKLGNNGPRIQFSLKKLRNPQVEDLFEAMIEVKFEALNLLEETIEHPWSTHLYRI